MTVVNTFSDSGNLTVYPGPTQPTAAVIVWQTNIPYLSNAADGPVDDSVLVADGGNSQGLHVVIDINGYFAATSDLSLNTALGAGALANNTAGSGNTASGFDALQGNTTGDYNTVSGFLALQSNTNGSGNTASGASALEFNTTGSGNTAGGGAALYSNTTGSNNTATGTNALQSNTTGSFNTVGGSLALGNNTTGSSNIAIGYQAAQGVSGVNSNDIHIGSEGASADSGTIRIGTSGTQTSFFAAGVRAITTGNSDAVPIVIDSNGQLGTVSSSRRFKEDIQDMGEASSGLMRWRPVTFRYKPTRTDRSPWITD